MSKEQIERRIRSLFYFLFGVIFTFLFILTSTYLNSNQKLRQKHKEQVKQYLVEGFQVREKQFFEEFMTRNHESIHLRVDNFLDLKGISSSRIAIIEDSKCASGQMDDCLFLKKIADKYRPKKILPIETLGNIYFIIPLIGWGQTHGYISITVKTSDVVTQPSFFNNLVYHVAPFVFLILITLYIYFYTEKTLIKPTIKRIIDTEKLQAQRSVLNQYAHDIRSPIMALETYLEIEGREGRAQDLIVEALSRIKTLSRDVLEREKEISKKTVSEVIEEIIKNKKLEYPDRNLFFKVDVSELVESTLIDDSNFYRVLSNLINNSIESTRGKNVELRIFLNLGDDGLLELSLKDFGSGIPKEKVPLIFKGGYTSKENGNGLGVSGAKAWIDRICGKMQIDSVEGEGTLIKLSIPI